MILRLVLLLFPALGPHVALPQTLTPTASGAYSAAIETSAHDKAGSLLVFAHGTDAIPVALPFLMGGTRVYGPGGKSFYGQRFYAQPMELGSCLYKIEFNPMRTTAVSCIPGLDFQSAAVSAAEDRLVFSGRYGQAGNWTCGVFEVSLPGVDVRPIFTVECPVSHLPWESLSLSPDGKRAVAIYSKGLARPRPFVPNSIVVIELDSGRTKSLGAPYEKAAWSPDGRFISAIESGGEYRTQLFDAATFAKLKTLPNSEAQWSPDSKYLLRVKPCASGEDGTFEALSVENGVAMPIKSSKCMVYNISTGWVSDSILSRAESSVATDH
jgi:WD40 repeat protein